MSILNQIKSIYVLNNIFQYIEYDNFKLKLFFYSKAFKLKLNLEYNYIENYFSLIKKKYQNIIKIVMILY